MDGEDRPEGHLSRLSVDSTHGHPVLRPQRAQEDESGPFHSPSPAPVTSGHTAQHRPQKASDRLDPGRPSSRLIWYRDRALPQHSHSLVLQGQLLLELLLLRLQALHLHLLVHHAPLQLGDPPLQRADGLGGQGAQLLTGCDTSADVSS